MYCFFPPPLIFIEWFNNFVFCLSKVLLAYIGRAICTIRLLVGKWSHSHMLPQGLYANLSRGACSFAPDSVTPPLMDVLCWLCICHFPMMSSHRGHRCFSRLTSCQIIATTFFFDRCSNIFKLCGVLWSLCWFFVAGLQTLVVQCDYFSLLSGWHFCELNFPTNGAEKVDL